MNGRARQLAIAAIVTLLVVVLAAWWLVTHERVEVEVRAPLRGEAAYNSLYALGQALREHGEEVDMRANFDFAAMAPGPHDTIVLGGDVRTLGEAQVDELLGWVGEGGALLLDVPNGTSATPGGLLAQLGLEPREQLDCLQVAVAAAAAQTADRKASSNCFWTFTLTDVDHDAVELTLGDADKGYYLVRSAYGDGQWSALGGMDFLENDGLDELAAMQFAWQVLGPLLQGGRVHLVYASDVPPLYVLLVRHGWPLLLPGLLALFAWLWARARRFGPLLPAPATTRRALREHVEAAGEFVFRERQASALYAPLRRAFNARLQREAPQVAALDGEDLVVAVAVHCGEPVAAVRAALQPVDLNQPERFLAAVRFLSRRGLQR